MLRYFFWTAFEKFGSQIINLLVQILLARILAPEIFGLIALIQIYIAVAQVIVEAGIGNYIIQKKELYNSDISTSLLINLFLAIIIYLVLFFTAPIVAGFYDQIILIDIVFSFDSILTAVGMTNGIDGALTIMILAVIISMVIMMVFANSVSTFVNNNPTIQMLALSFLILIGFMLIAEGAHLSHLKIFNKSVGAIPKGYLYFTITFSLIVEALNMKIRKTKKS